MIDLVAAVQLTAVMTAAILVATCIAGALRRPVRNSDNARWRDAA